MNALSRRDSSCRDLSFHHKFFRLESWIPSDLNLYILESFQKWMPLAEWIHPDGIYSEGIHHEGIYLKGKPSLRYNLYCFFATHEIEALDIYEDFAFWWKTSRGSNRIKMCIIHKTLLSTLPFRKQKSSRAEKENCFSWSLLPKGFIQMETLKLFCIWRKSENLSTTWKDLILLAN